MNTAGKVLLLVFIAALFSSCLWRRPLHKNWSTDTHPKKHYKKGNNFGGRRLWVRYF
jgi:hypothetical protein